MGIRRTSRALAAALLLAGCAPEAPDPGPFPEVEVGDPCNSGITLCLDDGAAAICEDRAWATVSCDEECLATSPAYVGGSCRVGWCDCELEDPEGCDPAESRCGEDGAVDHCSDEQEPLTSDCTMVCAGEGLGDSLGCTQLTGREAACICSEE